MNRGATIKKAEKLTV